MLESIVTDQEIFGFFGEYRFLSNFFLSTVEFRGITYFHSEGAYVAETRMRSIDMKLQVSYIESPRRAKEFGRTITPNHFLPITTRIGLMSSVLECKFEQNPDLLDRLLETGSKNLVEANTWNDTFWGVNYRTRKGENHLGKALMRVREELRILKGR
jgi:ribA/ribD-fused uncharacterized protein